MQQERSLFQHALQALTGKPWATLGFGSKQYPRFCAAAELFLQMAAEARVKNMQQVGKCNCDGNVEADFRLWVSDLLEKYVGVGLLEEDKLEEMQMPLALEHADIGVCCSACAAHLTCSVWTLTDVMIGLLRLPLCV
jgi:hypothetical protein